MKKFFYTLSVLVCLLGVSENAWADYNTWLRASTDDVAKGLVYTCKTQTYTPSDDEYGDLVMSDVIQGDNGKKQPFYGWAKPARGYAFYTWTGYKYYGEDAKDSEKAATFPSPKQATGVADLIYAASWSGGAGDPAAGSVKASWKSATSYNVVYKEPAGGSYTVDYSYVTINSNKKFDTSTEQLVLAPGSGDKRPYGIPDGSQEDLSYATDVVTLSTEAANFVGWYEDGVEKSTENPYIYPITKSANVTALFKWAKPVVPEDKLIRTTDNSANVNESVVFPMDYIASDWATADFTVTLVDATGSGTFTLGEYTYDATNKELTVPFTYNANGKWDEGSSVKIQVTPVYGDVTSATVRAIAQQNAANQARVSGDGITTQEGDLTDMLAIANANTKATLTLLQPVAVTEPLVVTATMTLDLNNQVLSSTEADRIISVAGTDAKLTITDNSFMKGGAIQLTRSVNDTIAAIEVTGANKLLYNCGKLTAANNAEFASNEDAKAFGIYVSGAGNVVMQGGSINVTSDRYARGVFIATTTGNATLNVGKIEATANLYVEAVYSGGKLNMGEGISLKATATDNWAAPLYILSGTAVVDYVTMTSISAKNNAYGVYSKAGTLTLNGCTITATAATPNVYGVYIAASGVVTIQQQTNITAQYTTTSVTGTASLQAFGIYNLGTVRVVNSNVTAISPADYATAVATITSTKKTTIEGGTYTARTATGYAYGLHHQYGTLSVDGGTFYAVSAGTGVYGARNKVAGTIKNATLSAETTGSGKTVYGIETAAKTQTLTNCTIKAKSATSGAYAIYNTNATVTATGCTLIAKTLSSSTACGFYGKKGTHKLYNNEATVDAFTTTAYGIYLVAGTLTVDGGTYNVYADQATATKAADSKVYGVFVTDGQTATLSNATFNVSATNGTFSQNAYGAYTGKGTINSTGCTYNTSAATKSYGVFGAASSTLNLQNNTINATTIASTKAIGIYSAAHFTVDGDDVTTHSKTYESYSLYFSATAQGEVLGGKFRALGTSTKSSEILAPINTDALAENVQVKGGFYSDNVRLRYYVPTGYEIFGVDPNAPEYAEQYYYTVNDHLPYENICYITEKNVGFPTLEEAFDYARNHSDGTYNIIMTQPYTLPAGNYSLPANATLVVPDRVSRTVAIGTVAERQFPEQDLITENRCLTFAEGVNLDVYGTIEVSAKEYTTNTGRISYVLGPYGRIHLENGSTVTLNNGAKINAWGYITGQGEIRVKNGAEVREIFQVHDMKAASAIPDWTTSANKTTYKAFLMNQYYIQSIEAPTKYYYGGKLIGSMSITSNATAWTSVNADNVQLVAPSDAFFTVDTEDESAWVRKSYDPTTDRVLWETNSSASLGSISVSMGSYGFDSKDYVLPFTNNMTIHALSGIFNITQSVVLLPGSEVIVDKTATLHINDKDVNGDAMGLYLYDKSQWTTKATPIMYSPSWTNGVCPRTTTAADMKDAAIYVKGKIEVYGALYTTEGGAAIYSDSENAGTIEYSADAVAEGHLYQKYDGTGEIAVTAAKLRNGGETGPDEDMTITKDVALNGDTYAYANIDGEGFKWTRLKDVDGCVISDETDPENPVYYAKPQGYVAITSPIEDENYLFHSVTGDRLFILQFIEAGCVWWEVTATETPGVYHCATNDTYYEHNPQTDLWQEVKRTVTFYFTDPKSEDADKKKVLTVNYGAQPDVTIVSNPSKAEDAAATYQFRGWKYGEDGPVHAYTATDYETVTENGTYYLPVFDAITKKYTITLKDAKNGADVPVEVFYGSVPEYTPTKDATAEYTYTFNHWEPELAPVTGAATYTAFWTNVKNRYTITWVDGETTLEEDKNQQYGTPTEYNGEQPAKETDDNYVYAFSGWLSSLDGNTYATGETPAIGGNTTYTAQYTTTPRYAVIFANYDGKQLQKIFVTAGEHPVYSGLTPARLRDVDGYYNFTGWKNSSGTFFARDAELPVVNAKETYTAQYEYITELYAITFRNVKGKGTTTGSSNRWIGYFGVGTTPFYCPSDVAATPTKASTAEYTYTFDGWSTTNGGTKLAQLPPVTKAATYWALFKAEKRKYAITFANVDGNGASEVLQVEYGTVPECPVTPAKEDNNYTYEFLGWDTEIASVTAAATYTAQFSETGTPRTFTITFEPENGDAAEVLQVAYGHMPQPTTPTPIAADVQYSYVFNSWYPTLSTVTGDATYYAQYTQTLNRYTVTFKDWDGTTLQSESLNYGVTPAYDATPTKPMDMEHGKMYTFIGWKNTNGDEYAAGETLPSVTQADIYTAQYEESYFIASVTTSADETSYYDSWPSALEAANASSGSTLKLLGNISGYNNSKITGSFTLDLNGYTISYTNTTTSNPQLIYLEGSLILEDSRGGGKLYYEQTGSTSCYVIDLRKDGTRFTMNGGTIECKKIGGESYQYACAFRIYWGKAYVNDGVLTATSDKSSAYAVYDYSEVAEISGGKLSATGANIVKIFSSGSKTVLSGGYYSLSPANTSAKCVSGKGVCKVRDNEPQKAEGYNYKVTNAHTITFKNYNGATLQTGASEDGYLPEYEGETPTKPNEDGRVFGFTGWDASLVPVTVNATYTAQYGIIGIDADDSEEPVEITEDMTVTTTIVETTGKLNVAAEATLTTTNLILEATSNVSGQLDAPANSNINVTGNAYFDWTPNGNAGTANRTWYAIAVPWEVNAETGIILKDNGRTLRIGVDFDLIYYSGSERASVGNKPSCWKYVQHDGDKTMHPGRLYMMYFDPGFVTIRFVKKSGADVLYMDPVNVSVYEAADDKDANWNGIANPKTYYASLSAGEANYAQVLNNGSLDDYFGNSANPVYQTIRLDQSSFSVGKPVFVQATDNDPVVVSKSDNATIVPASAPRRLRAANLPKGIEAVYRLAIAGEDQPEADNLFVQVAENEKTDRYTVGQDLVKGGVASGRAQVWVSRYDAKLSVNTQALSDGEATYPLAIQIPVNGEYTLHLTQSTSDSGYTVYLTRNDEAIWNLSNGAYVGSFEKGTTSEYGLRVSAKAPQIATGIDEAVVDAKGETRKVIINNTVYIIRGENVYSVDGQLVK
ncbi:MAG: hypothetical protein IJR42_05890 [Paludibacteraceae bacterium]|nr:hypothetical protein [Paludibacteraceae bacterium]